ncbi:hypothetical protein BV25DRAFT_1789986, partial [Artomyces pyxidatus]
QTLDDEIYAMREALCNAQMRRNAFAPISIIPPEILARIFEFHSFDCPPASDHNQAPSLGWIASATHVCRHWREVALDHPHLWGRISFAIGPEWTAEMVLRVKTAPISV